MRNMRHFSGCGICGMPGHKAKDCALNELEARKDPLGELRRRQEFRDRARARDRRNRLQLVAGQNVQTSPRFGT